MQDNIINELYQVIGKENVLTDKEDLICYSYDATSYSHLPEVVVVPSSAEEISLVLKVANKHRMPVVARGGGTNLCGASVPIKGGIVLAMHRLNKIIEIDGDNLVATVEAGVNTEKFQQAVEAKGLFYPPDPQSAKMSTMGGNVAQNAGGPRGFKYGVTRDFVLGMKVVLADGTILDIGGKTIKNVTGYDLTKFFTGSEGTLGVIIAITFRLLPLPEAKKTMLAVFGDLMDGARTISSIVKNKIIPVTLEMMDQETMGLIEKSKPVGLPTDAAAAILIEVDGSEHEVERQMKKIEKVARAEGATDVVVARTEEEAAKLWEGRKAAFGCMALSAVTPITEDATVPRSKLPEMVKFIKDVAKKYSLSIPVLGHTGDGNLHPIICTDENNLEEMERVEKAIDEIFKETLRLGGTLSGEHGIGLAKQKYMELEVGQDGLNLMRQLKKAVDPNNILNPGKIFLQETEQINEKA